jgi:hypothetical protein
VRFNVTNGLVSIVGNVAVTVALVRLTGMHYLAANGIAIVACSLANFLLSHRLVFAQALCLALLMMLQGANACAADLPAASAEVFERYARFIEARLDDERAGRLPYLWIDRLSPAKQQEARMRAQRGEVVVHRIETPGHAGGLSAALCHHWMGTVFLPGARVEQVVEVMQNYDRYKDLYRPAVRRSRVLSRDGGQFQVSLQLFMKKVISVVLNTESDVTYLEVDPDRMQVRSRSTRIAEVTGAGTPDEREEPVGHDSGFLWRFNNYCSLEQRDAGTYVQCESLSLTRDIPFGLGWMIGPFVTSIPRESLEFTLLSLRNALTAKLEN